MEEINNSKNKDYKEQEADEFAAKLLLDDNEYEEIINTINSGADIMETIRNYANEFGTHKDIIIGRILYRNKDLYKFGFLQKEIEKVDFDDTFKL